MWSIIRNKVRFYELIDNMRKNNKFVFVDLSPTGTLANYIKYGFENEIPFYSSINPFGKNIKTMDSLIENLKNI